MYDQPMNVYPVLLSDGTSIHTKDEFGDWLCAQGTSIDEVGEIMRNDLEEGLAPYKDQAQEYELVADCYRTNFISLIEEVEEAVSRLYAGKSSKGYRKDDIAYLLRNAINVYGSCL